MSILKREVFYSTKGDQVKFLDWARTTTTLGVMAEPFNMNERDVEGASITDFDPSDMMVKVDGLARLETDDDVKRALFNTGDRPIHGGNLSPRVLIFVGNN